MREVLLEYAKKGAMTKEDLAAVLKVKPAHVGAMARSGALPRIPNLRLIRFDPMELIRVLCGPSKKEESRSLTFERHKTGAKPTTGGLRKCL